MKNRCNNPTTNRYERYGERCIKVCDEWLNSFKAFENWAYTNGYREYLTIDRKDNDGNYTADNCRWVTALEQSRNTSKNLNIEIDGETKTLAEWSELSGIDNVIIHRRYWNGDRGKDLLRPPKNHRIVEIGGVCKTISEWSKDTGLSIFTLHNRYLKGIKGEELIRPVHNGKKFTVEQSK